MFNEHRLNVSVLDGGHSLNSPRGRQSSLNASSHQSSYGVGETLSMGRGGSEGARSVRREPRSRAAGGLQLPAHPAPPSLAFPECRGRSAVGQRVPDLPRAGRQPPDLNRVGARRLRRRDGRFVVAPRLAALPQGPPRLYVQELAVPGGLRLHPGAGESAWPPWAPGPPLPRALTRPRGDRVRPWAPGPVKPLPPWAPGS